MTATSPSTEICVARSAFDVLIAATPPAERPRIVSQIVEDSYRSVQSGECEGLTDLILDCANESSTPEALAVLRDAFNRVKGRRQSQGIGL